MEDRDLSASDRLSGRRKRKREIELKRKTALSVLQFESHNSKSGLCQRDKKDRDSSWDKKGEEEASPVWSLGHMRRTDLLEEQRKAFKAAFTRLEELAGTRMGSEEDEGTSSGATEEDENDENEKPSLLHQDVWYEVAKRVAQYDHLAFSATCKMFRNMLRLHLEKTKGSKTTLADLKRKTIMKNSPKFTKDWFTWIYTSFPSTLQAGSPLGWRNGIKQQYLYEGDLMILAAYQGDIKILEWLWSKGVDFDVNAGIAAAGSGQLEVLKWSKRKGTQASEYGYVHHYSCQAARRGVLHILKWLRGEGGQLSEGMFYRGARSGDLETVKWLREQGCPWDNQTLPRACKSGNLEVVKYLHKEGAPLDQQAFNRACFSGNLEIAQWLYSVECPVDLKACDFAASGGHIHVIKWLRTNGFEIGKSTCSSAAARGQIKVLEYLLSEGCGIDSRSLALAADGGHFHVLFWLQKQECGSDNSAYSPLHEGSGGLYQPNPDPVRWAHYSLF
ncbi:hypothetical protein HOP50_17g79530 [Chloropicon primus]|uniref:Ankyrin repeat domain-containing protein n=2 Tax=Chloropicon primus TaxID=1764295 RepID=A0A5B8N095_9CHLO|nr:hypothetical protein A3770_17p79300 [Chloropicon primus]UPR04609.1 hypothetical protein HOP50_17g79530 [Chloropicon primus]|eukprot:QDZ25412.1 hypothetical protein A3770_17p79300 [Chloropicon primus]